MKYNLNGIEFKYVHLELENEVYLTAFGFEDFTNRKSNTRVHKMQDVTLQFVEFGEGFYQLNDNIYKLKKGDLFYIPKNKPIMYKKNVNNPYKYFWISLNGANIEKFINNLGINDTNPILKIQDYDEILSYLYMLHPLTNQSSIEIRFIVFAILNIIQKSTNCIILKVDDVTSNTIWKDIIQFVEINLPQSDLSIDLISTVFHLNKVMLYRIFKKNVGISAKKYILQKRIEKAKSLLKNDETITSTSSKCGFADIYYFSKFFKEQVGMSPSDYKTHIKNK